MFRWSGLKIASLNLLMVSALVFGSDRAFDQSSEIDFSKLQMTFREDFDDTLSVSPWGPNTRWIAHTPWAGDFGDAAFADPRLGVFPFTLEGGIFRIEARKNDKGKWESGLLASADGNGRGFSQQYGYFEMRAKLPKGPGVWPAFWLGSIVDKTAPASVEIDVLEFYGHSPAAYQNNIIVYHTNPADAATSDVDKKLLPHEVKVPQELAVGRIQHLRGYGYPGMDHLLPEQARGFPHQDSQGTPAAAARLVEFGARFGLAD